MNNPLDTGYGYANAIQGVFDTYTESQVRTAADYRSGAFEEYLQDSWKASKRLTLEMGVRFTTWIPWFQRQGIQSGFDPRSWNPAQTPVLDFPGMSGNTRVAVNPITGQQLPAVYIGAIVPAVGNPGNGMIVGGKPGVPQGRTSVQGVTPAPRFGFAYDVTGDGKTAIRVGFGISVLSTTQPNTNLQSQAPLAYTPKTYYGQFASYLNTVGTLFTSNVWGTDWSQLAQNYSFSLGVQREVGFSTVIDVAAVGNLGRRLLMSQNLNTLPYGKRFLASSQDPTTGKPLADSFLAPYTGYGNVTYGEPVGTSNYYALQVQGNRRFSHGLEFKANWTWSKSMDYGSGDSNTLPLYASWRLLSYGKSSFDRTHIVNLAWLYGERNRTRWFNTSVFAVPALGYIGSAPRDVYRGPGQNQWDIAAFKDFAPFVFCAVMGAPTTTLSVPPSPRRIPALDPIHPASTRAPRLPIYETRSIRPQRRQRRRVQGVGERHRWRLSGGGLDQSPVTASLSTR